MPVNAWLPLFGEVTGDRDFVVQYYEDDEDWGMFGMGIRAHCELLCKWARVAAGGGCALLADRLEPQRERAAQPPPSVAATQAAHTPEPSPTGQQQQQPPPNEEGLTQQQDLARNAALMAQQLIEVSALCETGIANRGTAS